MPRFSIVVPAYNAESTLAETLDAIRSQMFQDWECVVVDDGSGDGTLELARSYAQLDRRFSVVSQQNKGTGGAYNTGVSASKGDWISICSADDLLLPEHLITMNESIDSHPGCDIISCNGYFLWPDGTRELVYDDDNLRTERSWSLEETFANCFYSVGACYRREVFVELGGYLEDAYGEDYDFWLRALSSGFTHLFTPQPLSVHRRSPEQKTSSKFKVFESDIDSIQRVLESGSLSHRERRAARIAIKVRRSMIAIERSPGTVLLRLRKRFWVILGRMGLS